MAEQKESTMSENDETSAEATESTSEEKRSLNLKGYERLINRMQEERKELQKELSKDYREARHYVRENPEEGIMYAFVGGLAIGLLLGTRFTGTGGSHRSDD